MMHHVKINAASELLAVSMLRTNGLLKLTYKVTFDPPDLNLM